MPSHTDRLATLDIALLSPDAPETDYVQRVRLDISDSLDERDPVEIHLNPLSHRRVEIAVGEHVISIGYAPPDIHPETPRFENIENPIARRMVGMH